MKVLISLITALGLLFAGILAVIRGGGGDETPPPVTEAPPIAASDGRTFIPPAMPAGPHDAQSIVAAYNLSRVLEMPTTERGVWGGQQTRIVRQGGDLYVLYGVVDAQDNVNDWAGGDCDYALYRYSSVRDEWTYFYTLRSYEVPGLHAAADGNVYAAYVHARGLGVLEYDPNTDKITLRDSGVYWPATQERDHWSYMSTGVSQGRYIWFQGNGNLNSRGRPGGMAFYRYDTVTRTFSTGANQRWLVDYRHCYNYVLDDRNGGLIIAGGRDIFWDASEWKQPEGVFDAIFDEINYWTFKDDVLSDIHRVDKAMQGRDCAVPNAHMGSGGDAYLDLDGNLHILYFVISQSTGGRAQQWHAVYKDGVEIKKECFLDDGNQHSLRLIEDSAGQLYLLDIPYNSHILRLYTLDKQHNFSEPRLLPIGDAQDEGTNFGLQYAGMSVTAPRSGSAPADFVDVIYPNADRTNWIYFRLRLR